MKRSEIEAAAMGGMHDAEGFEAGARWALEQAREQLYAVSNQRWYSGAFDAVEQILTVEDDHE